MAPASPPSDSPITIHISHRGTTHKVLVSPSSPLSEFQNQIHQLTSIPPSLQKLLYKGKKPGKVDGPDEVTVRDVGLKDGIKVQLLGSTIGEIESLHAIEDERRKRERIMRERASKPQAKVRSTGFASTSTPSLQYRFHNMRPLAHLPNPSSATSLLNRLADDPAIQHVMAKHKFSVGLLTELAPHEHPNLLGLNVNAGQEIKLRLRTDKYDGFRLYSDVRRVLCHELTHNVWGDHDENFKQLNSQLNREVAEFERSSAEGSHRLGGSLARSDYYEPLDTEEIDTFSSSSGGGYTLGGGGSSSSSIPFSGVSVDDQEDRRQRVLQATLRRLNKVDEEIEQSCGTASTGGSGHGNGEGTSTGGSDHAGDTTSGSL
ncbi:hypothetical protein AX16_003321 [Volvariella volvacea WC 439]|nr:hypothetical protein AX16_003321 [Volvariella volvacea WC 439]